MAGYFKLINIVIFACFLSLCIVQVLTKSSGRKNPEPTIEEKIETFVKDVCECKSIKGLTLAVVKDDKILMTKGFGYKNLETGEKVDENTVFGIASLTKAFTAATIAKFLQESNITLTTPLSEFINITFPSEQLNSYTTLEDLLAHRTGLDRNNYIRLNPDFNRRTHHQYLKYFGIEQDFRTGFYYNNVMYGLASYITELLTNTSWEEAVNTQLLKPLGMNKTTFSTTADVEKLNIAHPYLYSKGKGFKRVSSGFTKKWGELGGSGAMLSNAPDMTRWMRFLLNEGEIDGERIVNSTYIDDLFKIRNHPGSRTTYLRPNIPITISDGLYSLGWRMGYYRGFPMITHTGSTWGYKAMLTLIPSQKFGIFTAQIGSDDGFIKRRLIHSYIADLYLGERPWLNQTSACSFPWTSSKKKVPVKKRETVASPKLDKRSDFTGIYSNQLWGDLRFEMTKSGLKMVYGYASFKLSPSSISNPLAFKAVGMGENWFMKLSKIEFGTDRKNKKRVVSVTVYSFEKHRPPTFYKTV